MTFDVFALRVLVGVDAVLFVMECLWWVCAVVFVWVV